MRLRLGTVILSGEELAAAVVLALKDLEEEGTGALEEGSDTT